MLLRHLVCLNQMSLVGVVKRYTTQTQNGGWTNRKLRWFCDQSECGDCRTCGRCDLCCPHRNRWEVRITQRNCLWDWWFCRLLYIYGRWLDGRFDRITHYRVLRVDADTTSHQVTHTHRKDRIFARTWVRCLLGAVLGDAVSVIWEEPTLKNLMGRFHKPTKPSHL